MTILETRFICDSSLFPTLFKLSMNAVILGYLTDFLLS